jgi:hypothetical protein
MANNPGAGLPEGDQASAREAPTPATADPIPAWRAGIDADRRKRRRRPRDNRETLRLLTVGAAVAATGLNTVLFAQTAVGQFDPGAVQSAIVSVVSALFPDANLQAPSNSPSPPAGSTPVVVTGGS